MTRIHYDNQQATITNDAGMTATGFNGDIDAQGFRPKELLEAAVALCMTMNVRKVLERDGIDFQLEDVAATATASKEDGITNRFTAIDVELTLPAHLEAAYRTKLIKIAERGCTIGNTIKASASISVTEA